MKKKAALDDNTDHKNIDTDAVSTEQEILKVGWMENVPFMLTWIVLN